MGPRAQTASGGRLAGAVAVGGAAVVAGVFASLAVLAVLTGAVPPGGLPVSSAAGARVSALARTDIPVAYLRLYEDAARRYGLDWSILAGIGKVECDHGRDPDPSCSRPGAVNAAGAGGPMQFLAATFSLYGVDADGTGRRSRWDPADAIFSAANYLRACGAPRDYRSALLAYNHAAWYVAEVERWAARYRAQPASAARGSPGPPTGSMAGLQSRSATPVLPIEGERARLERDDGHVALIPRDVPATVQAMLIAGNELQDLPYGPGGHPNPLGASEEDCSSTVNYVLYRAGVRTLAEIVRDNPLAQDYTRWGAPGPGRWVTIYATFAPTPHVFVVIAGLRLDTSRDGTDVGPNRDQDGPRWRIFPRIPAWARWSIRHPPGL